MNSSNIGTDLQCGGLPLFLPFPLPFDLRVTQNMTSKEGSVGVEFTWNGHVSQLLHLVLVAPVHITSQPQLVFIFLFSQALAYKVIFKLLDISPGALSRTIYHQGKAQQDSLLQNKRACDLSSALYVSVDCYRLLESITGCGGTNFSQPEHLQDNLNTT